MHIQSWLDLYKCKVGEAVQEITKGLSTNKNNKGVSYHSLMGTTKSKEGDVDQVLFLHAHIVLRTGLIRQCK